MMRRTITGLLAAAIAAAALTVSSASAMHRTASSPGTSSALVADLARARVATAKYVNNLGRAKADGYQIITQMIPNMGWHYMNASVKGFNVTKPPILVYERRGAAWQLAAIEWVFPSKPATPPLPGAKYGSFGAGCHYKDGTFAPADSQSACPTASPQTGAAFSFWHPVLITLHVWLWYPNPSGLFASTNPLVAPFNEG
jgi:hypothetical protein